MCGRFTQIAPWSEVFAFSQPLGLRIPEDARLPRWNIAPSTPAGVIALDHTGGATVGTMHWGLMPPSAGGGKTAYSTFNARIETAAEKPLFRTAWQRRRCLVPADGYYEWVPDGDGRKTPFYLQADDAPMLMFAGLWDRWAMPDGEARLGFTVVTEPAEGPMAALHERRPLMLRPAQFEAWLRSSAEALPALLAAERRPLLRWHAVGPAVGNVRNEGPSLIEPLSPPG